MIYVMNKKYL